MEVIYGLIPMMLFFGFLVVVVFIWMAKKGYFDDMDGQAHRILMDDDYPESDQTSHSDDKTPKDSEPHDQTDKVEPAQQQERAESKHSEREK